MHSLDFDFIKSYSNGRLTFIRDVVGERFACYTEVTALLYVATNNSENLGKDVVVEEIDNLANDEITVTETYKLLCKFIVINLL